MDILWLWCNQSNVMQLYLHECNAHMQRGKGKDYSMQYEVNFREVSAPAAPKVA